MDDFFRQHEHRAGVLQATADFLGSRERMKQKDRRRKRASERQRLKRAIRKVRSGR